MNSDSGFEYLPDDVSLENVENLIQQMSLKKPSREIHEANVVMKDNNSLWLVREFLVGIACLLVGVLMGRWSNVVEIKMPGVESSDPLVVVNDAENVSSQESGQLKMEKIEEVQVAEDGGHRSEIELIDNGLFLMDGKFPVRRFTSISRRTVSMADPETGEPVSITIPVKKTVLTTSIGT